MSGNACGNEFRKVDTYEHMSSGLSRLVWEVDGTNGKMGVSFRKLFVAVGQLVINLSYLLSNASD